MTSERNPYFDATTQGGPSRSAAPDAPDEPAGTATAPWTGTGTAPTTILNPPTPDRELPPEILPPSLARTVRFRSLGERQPSSIRLRRGPDNAARAPSLNTIPFDSELQTQSQQDAEGQSNVDNNGGRFSFGRRRASSDARSRRGSQALPLSGLPTIPDAAQGHETGGSAPVGVQDRPHFTEPVHAAPVQTGPNGATAVGLFIRNEYKSDIVDFLDVVDPEVATLSSITNVQNSLFVPSLGRFINRRPTYDLSFARRIPGAFPELPDGETEVPTAPVSRQTTLNRTFSITSEITPAHYAVLPSGTSLEGWSREDVDQINDHVRHMLHSRRARMKRSLKAFGKYVRRPLGFFVTLYATLITLFGLAWVLFLIGWIYVGDKQLYAINVIDNILVALFAVVGDGLAPFRAVDTYHLIFIVRYHRLTWKLRKKMALPKLENKNDLPKELIQISSPGDPEAGRVAAEAAKQQEDPVSGRREISVLNPKQQASLIHHQDKMTKSHTFYKPHETETHYAFPLSLLISIILLLDLHSCLQISLGAVTWGIDYHERSTALTTTILCCSITANTTAGILIAIGDRRTRKKDVIERMLRQELTDQAIQKVQKEKRAREAEEAAARKDPSQVGRFDVSTRISDYESRNKLEDIQEGGAEVASPEVPGRFPE